MEFSEVKKQFDNWLDNKLSNPYFGAVIAIWAVTNRVLIFGLFNFDAKNTLDQRIAFVHQQLESFKRLDFILGFHGFYATVVWSFGWGFIAMLFFDQINTLAKAAFKWGHRSKNNILQRIEQSKWMETKHHLEVEKANMTLEEEMKTKRIEANRIQKDYDEAIKLYSNIKKLEEEKDKTIVKDSNQIIFLEEKVIKLEEEKNKFRIIYARYGKDEKFQEVTKIVSDLILSKKKFMVGNDELGGDPIKFKIKELFIEYVFNQLPQKITANEGEIVEFKDDVLEVLPTEDSKQKQLWLLNQNKISDVFKDEWILTYTKDEKPNYEKIRVDSTGRYFINDIHTFNLLVTELNNKKINLKKINLKGDEHSTETLTISNDRLIIGQDNKGYSLEYKKNDSPNIQIAMNIALKDRDKIFKIINQHPEYSLLKTSTHENSIKRNYFTLTISNGNDLIYSNFENFIKNNKIEYIDYKKI